jgi:hypothetical protein
MVLRLPNYLETMNTPPPIEKEIPIPSRSKWGDVVAKMEVGDSVLVTMTEASAVRSQARMGGMSVMSRTIEPNRVRVWRTK